MTDVDLAVIGGSGLSEYAAEAEPIELATPYGATSAPVSLLEFGGRTVAFLPRHGRGHRVPPHRINYRANLWALASLGVRTVVSSSAVGGLSAAAEPGRLAIPSQLIDRTHGRADTFYEDGMLEHLPAAEPFDPRLGALAGGAVRALGEDVLEQATTVVINGPRFATRAEHLEYRRLGADLINMTQYPEAVLAAELNLSLVTLCFITDRDAAVDGATEPTLNAALVFERFAAAQPRILAALEAIVRAVPADFEPRTLIRPESVAAVLGADR